ncbi:hypothetical protein [uncultured Campylobacter sp.]|uniref:hypothetical protein n=1 Tax=uncultured Campylobacter sp. TaxID=218934 RepID=UPI0028E51CEE|nr:hypothetical protein [uncultured Campylobacter sp.]
MISGVNGFGANVNYDFSSAHERNLKALEEKEAINLTSNSASSRSNLTEPIDYYALDPDELDENELAVWAQNVEFSKLNDKQQNRLLAIKMGFKKPVYKPYDPVVARKAYSLSGYTEDDKISIWGKINGLDPSMSKSEVAELKKFIDSTKVLQSNSSTENDAFSVDGFMSAFNVDIGSFGVGNTKGTGLKMAVDMAKLLDSDMDIDKFKDKWLEFTAEKILGENAKVKISLKDGKLNFDRISGKRPAVFWGQEMVKQVSYADEATKKEFLSFLKDAFKKGESIADVLQNIALKDVTASDQTPKETPEENKFKPIQAVSKSQTYVYKDIKREFFENFLKAEQEKGTDIMELLRKLGKMGLDLKA